MKVRLTYLDDKRALRVKLLAGVQLGPYGAIYEPSAGGEWTELETSSFAEQLAGAPAYPVIEPELEGQELVCVIAGGEVARSLQGFRVVRGVDENDVDRLASLDGGQRPAYADWLAGEWMKEGQEEGLRGERLIILDSRLLEAPPSIRPGVPLRPSSLSG